MWYAKNFTSRWYTLEHHCPPPHCISSLFINNQSSSILILSWYLPGYFDLHVNGRLLILSHMTLAQTEKKFMIIKRLILQSCSWMYYLLDSSTCSHFTKDFIWEFSSSFGDRTEAFSLLLSSSACLYPQLHSPLSLPLPSRTVHIYSYSCSCSWIYLCYCEA